MGYTHYTPGRHPGGIYPLYTQRGTLVGIYHRCTPREAPWWVYMLLCTPREATLVGICSSVHPGRLPWWVYTREGGMQGVQRGIYQGGRHAGCVPWCIPRKGKHAGCVPGCIPRVYKGGNEAQRACFPYSRFTVGQFPASHPLPASLLGSSPVSPPSPFHCWAMLQSPPFTRFTVGQERGTREGYPPTHHGT